MAKRSKIEEKINIVYLDGLIYEVNVDGTARVSKVDDIDKFVRIADEVEDEEGRVYKVTEIGDEAFSACDILETVEIPDGIIKIGEWAFSACDNLKTVKLPNTLKELNKATFYDCKNLQMIVIPDCVTRIGDSAFYGCNALSDLILPEGLSEIGSSAFDYCNSLKSIYISQFVTDIGDRAFDHCESLEDIQVDPANAYYSGDGIRLIEKITNNVLYKCKNKKKTNSDIEVEAKFKEESLKTFMDGKDVKDMLIKDGFNYFLGYDYTAAIVENYNRDSMPKRLNIPVEVDDGDGATYKIKELYGSLFFYQKKLEEVYIPEGVEVIGDNTFAECKNLKTVNLPTTLKLLGARVFSSCVNLTQINMNNMIKKIEKDAFFECSNLDSFVLPEYLEEIEERAFGLCKKLTTVTLSPSLKKIGRRAFCHCDNLKGIYIPPSVEEISGDAFDGCNSFESIEVSVENPKFYSDGNCVIEKSTGILTVGSKSSVIPEGVREIAENAFYGRSLRSIDLPSGIVRIGDRAFENCFGLMEIFIPETVTEIGDGAFEKCMGAYLRCEARERPAGWSEYMGVTADRIQFGCVRQKPKPQKSEGLIKRIIKFFTGKN